MPPSTTVLITGSKSGIGRALLEAYALRPHYTVIAAIRDAPDSAPAKDLLSVPTGTDSRVIVEQYDAASPSSADELVAKLSKAHNISSLDIVIANAGLLNHSNKIKDSSAEDFISHFRINTVGPILLYKATANLLNASKQEPKFFVISSTLASNGLLDDYPWSLSAYSMSKAAVNWAAGKIHREEDRVVVAPVHPGWVKTAMGTKAAHYGGGTVDDVPVTIEESVRGIMQVFDKATKAEYSGRFWDLEGKEVPW
jgi:norsolorinic acid ketoreductase